MQSVRGWGVVPTFLIGPKLSQRKLGPMTVSSPNVIEIKLDRLIDDMRLLRSQTIAFDRQLKGIEAHLKPSEQPLRSKSRAWFAALASATARTVLFAVGQQPAQPCFIWEHQPTARLRSPRQ